MAVAKKSSKKASSKKRASTSGSRPAASRTTTTDTTGDAVFSTNAPPPAEVDVPQGTVRLFVNGRDEGNTRYGNQRLGAFAVDVARSHGIRNFSIYADGQQALKKDAERNLSSVRKLEIVPKDSRGSDQQGDGGPSGSPLRNHIPPAFWGRVRQFTNRLTPEETDEFLSIVGEALTLTSEVIGKAMVNSFDRILSKFQK